MAWIIVLVFLLVEANQLPCWGFNLAQSASSSANHKSDDLVLIGTVTKFYPLAAAPRPRLRGWAVVVRVDSVVSGEFSGTTFTFTVHSPARAGLRVNRAYIIRATKTEGGYVVNEFTLEEARAGKKPSGKH